MKTWKISLIALVLCACLGPFARQTSADSVELTFGQNMGGQTGSPNFTATPLTGSNVNPYATVTLNLVGNTIVVSGTTLSSNINFYDQTSEGGIFGFAPSAGTVSVGGCFVNMTSTNACSIIEAHTGTPNSVYGSYGTFGDSVGIGAGTAVGSGASAGYAFSSFQFTLTDASNPFTSVSQIINASPTNLGSPVWSGATDIASDVCEQTSGDGCNVNGANLEHTYVGLTPEPGSYLLFGTGLLGLGILLREKKVSLPSN